MSAPKLPPQPMNPALAYVSATLKAAVAAMPNRVRERARECFEHYRTGWLGIHAEPPASIAYTVHEMLDEQMRELATTENGRKTTCGKGCAHCCHLSVDAFPQEAVLLRTWAQEQGIAIDEARLARQATKTHATWHELPFEDRRCVFLAEDRTCRVYEHRPSSCRKYTVLSDPDLCDSSKYPGGKVGIVFSLEAELMDSAAMTVYGVGNMAAMLLKHKPPKNEEPNA